MSSLLPGKESPLQPMVSEAQPGKFIEWTISGLADQQFLQANVDLMVSATSTAHG